MKIAKIHKNSNKLNNRKDIINKRRANNLFSLKRYCNIPFSTNPPPLEGEAMIKRLRQRKYRLPDNLLIDNFLDEILLLDERITYSSKEKNFLGFVEMAERYPEEANVPIDPKILTDFEEYLHHKETTGEYPENDEPWRRFTKIEIAYYYQYIKPFIRFYD